MLRSPLYLEAQLPSWFAERLDPLNLALFIFLAAWLLLLLLLWWHRRAYNLTVAETTSKKVKDKPAFLEVDHEAREAAIKRGDDYVRPDDAAAAEAEARQPGAPPPTPFMSRFLIVVRVATVLFAATNLILVIGSCLNLIDSPGEDFASLPAVDRWRIIVNEYWVPLITSLAILAAQALMFLRGERRKQNQTHTPA